MPPRRQKPPSAKIEVPDPDSMLAQVFRLHVQVRHPLMRFRSKGEHVADHRLHGDSLDHIHVEGVTDDDAGEQDQGTHN